MRRVLFTIATLVAIALAGEVSFLAYHPSTGRGQGGRDTLPLATVRL